MTRTGRLLPHAWIVTLLLAAAFFSWGQSRRAQEVKFVTAQLAAPAALDPASPTGYAGGVRQLLVPGHNNESYQWIAQTQQMLAEHRWRLRHVDYDNAPIGRDVRSPSPYRWWLAAVAWGDHALSGRTLGLSVEHAALSADPLLFFLFLIGATALVARRLDAGAGALFPLALVALYPLSGGFLPGAPDDNGLAILLGGTAALLLLIGLREGRGRGWFIASGVVGGLGLWVSVGLVAPVLAGLGLGALGLAWVERRGTVTRPWRAWAVAGAASVVAAWLIEYAPAHLDLSVSRLSEVHPLYALAWLGGGELLVRVSRRLRGAPAGRFELVALVLAALAVAAVPAIMAVKHVPGFLALDPFALRLTGLGETAEAANWATWLVREGASWRVVAQLVPLAVLVGALLKLCLKATPAVERAGIVLLLGPVAAGVVLACTRLSWWNQADLLLLLLLAAGGVAGLGRLAAVALLLVPGLVALTPAAPIATKEQLTRRQQEALVERNFAQWLARRVGPDGAIVLAPPNLTASLYFHGGLRGLGSPYRENEDGFRAAVRIAGATSADEAQALARQRKLTHIAIPSWDGFLDEYARLGADQPEHTLMGLLNTWLPPRWLKPVPYFLPAVSGFEDDRLIVFEQTEPQDQATALSRLSEYFVDMGQVELGSLAAQVLARDYSADLGAQIAVARAQLAQRDRAALAGTIETILKGVQDGSGEGLAWDRRVSLGLVLAESGRTEEAKIQVQRCLEEMGEIDVRTLSQVALYRFLVTAKTLGLRVEDAALRDLARSLLPVNLQSRV